LSLIRYLVLLTDIIQICPLSLWERVRVRAVGRKMYYLDYLLSLCPHPLPLSQRERGDFHNLQKSSVN
jgi:hypothetical protein